MVRHIYENYIMRDLNYVISGTIASASIILAAHNDYQESIKTLKGILGYITQNLFTFIIFLFLAYAVGLICNQACVMFGIMKIPLENPRNKEVDFTIFLSELYKNEGPEVMKLFERLTYLKFVGAAYGAAFVVSMASALYSLIRIGSQLSFIFVIFSIVNAGICIKMNRKFWNRTNRMLNSFKNNIDEKRLLENLETENERNET